MLAAITATSTPTPNASRSPKPTITAIAANDSSWYRLRLSPRATAALSVPQVHSEPATAAP